MRKPMREFCGLKRNSDSLPLATLLKGMLPKFEPMLEPAFLSRHRAVKSIKPMGTRHVLPSRMKAGAGPSGTSSHGLAAATVVFWAALITGVAMGAMEGIMGVVLATSPKALLRGRAKVSWPSRAGALLP